MPEKYRTYVEGLVGNFNGNYSDDLFNRQTNQIVNIRDSMNSTQPDSDEMIYNACRSCKFTEEKYEQYFFFSGRVPGDTTPELSRPIQPTRFVDWYKNESTSLTSLNPRLNLNIVQQVCNSNDECIHDYVIRINEFTSGSTASGLLNFQESRTTLGTIVI